MTASAHKSLVLGADVIYHLLLPIGTFSEEAQEARNEHLRPLRLHHAQKDSREHNMTDVAEQLFVTRDPVISGLIWPDARHRQEGWPWRIYVPEGPVAAGSRRCLRVRLND